jgi:hypothetical protein
MKPIVRAQSVGGSNLQAHRRVRHLQVRLRVRLAMRSVN